MRKVRYRGDSLDNFIALATVASRLLMTARIRNEWVFQSIDCMLLGRKTFEVATGHSAPKRKSKKAKRNPSGDWGMKSYVFSRTIKAGPEDDFTVISENAGEFVRKLKNESGKDIWLMGGGELAGSLLDEGVGERLS